MAAICCAIFDVLLGEIDDAYVAVITISTELLDFQHDATQKGNHTVEAPTPNRLSLLKSRPWFSMSSFLFRLHRIFCGRIYAGNRLLLFRASLGPLHFFLCESPLHYRPNEVMGTLERCIKGRGLQPTFSPSSTWIKLFESTNLIHTFIHNFAHHFSNVCRHLPCSKVHCRCRPL